MKIVVEKIGNVCFKKISKKEAELLCDDILSLINIIPHLNNDKDDLFEERNPKYSKWEHSICAYNETMEIIGILLAYYIESDDKHDMSSLYIHRLAIKKEYQKHGIGKQLLSYFLKTSFETIPYLNTISIQTNQEYDNQYVIDFYHSMGFIDKYTIQYPDKLDILMIITREKYTFKKYYM